VDADLLADVNALPGVETVVAEVREQVDALRGHPALRRRKAEVAAESLLRGARASAALAWADWPLEELRRRTDFGADGESAPIRGALRVAAETERLGQVWRTAPIQAITRLHALAVAGELPPDRVGRPRTDADPVVGEAAALGGVPPAASVAARLRSLTRALTGPAPVPALVAAAVVHGELLGLAVFGAGDGLVARAAHRLVLRERGLDPDGLVVSEVGFAEMGADAYRRALAGYVSGGPDGVVAWVRACGEAAIVGARESRAVCEALLRG
jgi:hypothetical protein